SADDKVILEMVREATHSIPKLVNVTRDERKRLENLGDSIMEGITPSFDDLIWFARTGFRESGAVALRDRIEQAVIGTRELRGKTKVTLAIENAIADHLADADSSVRNCNVLEERQLRFVAGLFQLMIEADGQILPAEVRFARELLAEYRNRFVQSDFPHRESI